MVHFIPLSKNNPPKLAKAYRENVLKYHGFTEDAGPDRDGTFTSQYFTDLSN